MEIGTLPRTSRQVIEEARGRAEQIEETPWEVVLEHLDFEWEQGQHMTLLGRNGSGKTTAAIQLLDVRHYVFVLLTKRRDDLFAKFKTRGYKMIDEIGDIPDPRIHPKVAYHISPGGLGRKETEHQANRIREALHFVWDAGGWTLYIDEIAQLSDLSGLAPELRSLWKEARSSKVSLVAGTQRPARVPLEAYSQPRYLLLWQTKDRAQIVRLSEMNATDPEVVKQAVPRLRPHEILVVDTYDDALARTTPPPL
jgi:hypothetical protein